MHIIKMTDRRVIKKKVALGIIVLLLASRKYAVTNQRGSCARKFSKCRPKKGEFHSLVQNLRPEGPELHKKSILMSKTIFDRLLEMVSLNISHENTHEIPISASEGVAVTLK